MSEKTEQTIKSTVKERYGEIARQVEENADAGCSCCGEVIDPFDLIKPKEQSNLMGYSAEEINSLPEGAIMGLGCGNPQAIAAIQAGEVVLDLGSGAAALGRKFLDARRSAAGAALLLWATPAHAQDIGGVVLLMLPAVVLAPLAALAVKWIGLRFTRSTAPSLRHLAGLALLEFLLWEVAYPAGALFDLKIVCKSAF